MYNPENENRIFDDNSTLEERVNASMRNKELRED